LQTIIQKKNIPNQTASSFSVFDIKKQLPNQFANNCRVLEQVKKNHFKGVQRFLHVQCNFYRKTLRTVCTKWGNILEIIICIKPLNFVLKV